MDDDAPVRIPPEKNRGGVWVTFGAEQYRVPALGFRAIQDLQDNVQTVAGVVGMPTRTQLQAIVEILHRAIERNYPSVTADQVLDMLDIANYRETLDAVFRVSGFARREGGSSASGEAPASTGTGSTPS